MDMKPKAQATKEKKSIHWISLKSKTFLHSGHYQQSTKAIHGIGESITKSNK